MAFAPAANHSWIPVRMDRRSSVPIHRTALLVTSVCPASADQYAVLAEVDHSSSFPCFMPMADPPSVSVNVCNLPMDHGGTRCPEGVQSSQRYYYNAKQGICQQFTYSGCDGNDNNFASVIDCDNFCGKGDRCCVLPLPSAYKRVFAGVCQKGEPARSGGSLQHCSGDGACLLGYECLTPVYGPAEKQICCPSKSKL